MTVSRRLLLVALVALAPVTACVTAPTGVDEPPPPPAPGDSTGRAEQKPWN